MSADIVIVSRKAFANSSTSLDQVKQEWRRLVLASLGALLDSPEFLERKIEYNRLRFGLEVFTVGQEWGIVATAYEMSNDASR